MDVHLHFGSAFYIQATHEIAELNFQFILRFGLQVSDNGEKFRTQVFIYSLRPSLGKAAAEREKKYS
jgi:hypothetical protein